MNCKKNGLLAGTLLMVLTVSLWGQDTTPRLSSVLTDPLRLGPISGQKAPNNDNLRYGVVFPFQIGPTMAAAFVNRGVYTANWNYDFEDGSDVILFDNVATIQANNAICLNRSGVEPDSDFGGQNRYFNRFPTIGGFVPYGAKVGDTYSHPHAGTGFGISQVLTFPVASDGTFSWSSSPICRKLEIFQFSYQGSSFQVLSTSVRTEANPLTVPNSPWIILSGGISMAIPDGYDLLFPVWARNGTTECVGISRWSRIDGSWQVVSFIPIAYSETGVHNYYEPSLIREAGGALLFAARDDGRQNPPMGTAREQDINAWRSTNGGMTWSHILHVDQVRSGPMCIGISLNGIPFIVGDPIINEPPGSERDLMYLWTFDANSVLYPMCVRYALGDFGTNPYGAWYVDHPNNTILRLYDGNLHCYLAYRVRDPHVYGSAGVLNPSSQSGSYIEEVISMYGTPVPIWQF